MSRYADSSFLVSCFILDAHTPAAKTYLSQTAAPLVFTALHALEVRNALKLGVFRGLFTKTEALAAWANLEADVRAARLSRVLVNWALAFRIAGRLSEQHSEMIGTRSLDILHVAIAMTLRASEFVSFDMRQRSLAGAIKLRVAP